MPLPEPPRWPTLAPEALHGLAGEYVRLIEPITEADPVAVLIQVLAGLGNLVGKRPHLLIEGSRHYVNLFVALVGDTAIGRKGTSYGRAMQLLAMIDPEWAKSCFKGGLSSGEGLVFHVRDSIAKLDPKKGTVVVDEGVKDKRMLCYEPEFASVMASFKRDSNSLSALLRQCWEGGKLATLTRNNSLAATDPHISLVVHVTAEELRSMFDKTQRANGMGNRLLWVLTRRSKALPFGGDEPNLGPLAELLRKAVDVARSVEQMELDRSARER